MMSSVSHSRNGIETASRKAEAAGSPSSGLASFGVSRQSPGAHRIHSQLGLIAPVAIDDQDLLGGDSPRSQCMGLAARIRATPSPWGAPRMATPVTESIIG